MIKDETLKDQLTKVLKFGGVVVATTAVAETLSSSLIIPAIGFTKVGVAAGTKAALWHSSIGAVKAGTVFAKLQSAGAVGKGVLVVSGVSLPVVVGVTATVGAGYIVYKNQDQI